MKTEKFDEEIRRKIERLNFPPSEDDVERVHSFVRLHHAPTFWGKFGKIITYSTAAAVLTGSVVYNIIQHYENKVLLKNIETIKQVQQLPAEPTTKVEHRTDTVYVTQYVRVPVRVGEEQADRPSEKLTENAVVSNQNNSTENIVEIGEVEGKKLDKTSVEKTNPQTKNNANVGAESKTVMPSNPAKLDFTKKEVLRQNAQKNGKNVNDLAQIQQKSSNTSDNNFRENVSDSPKNISQSGDNTTNGIVPEEQKELSFSEKELKNKQALFDSSGGIEEKYTMISYARRSYNLEEKSHRRSFQLPSISINGVKFRTGLAGEFSHEQLGVTALGEALIGKHIGVSFGLKVISNFDEKYFTDAHFEQQNHEDFRKNYAPQIPDNKEILNISFRKSIVSVPLQVNYYKSIGKNLWLLGGIGTDLDVAVSQDVKFDTRESSNNFQASDERTQMNAVTFNNLHYALGAEFRLKHFDFQISPMLVTHFRDVPYIHDNKYLASQFRIFYRF